MQGAVSPHVTAFVIFAISLIIPCWSYTYRCDGSPEHYGASKSSSNNRFTIKISGNPSQYVPGWRYVVTLQSTKQLPVPEKFIAFALNVERTQKTKDQLAAVGTFHLYGDSLAKFSERCPNMVTQASNALRSEVSVYWTAPPVGSGCVTFRATVIEQRDLWFMHDGFLSKNICEDIQENIDELSDTVEECCACNEAKYEVTFEGLWSRHHHPKDFPPNGWMTKFSDVIGASHNADYKFWEYGGTASDGLAELVELGNTKDLEKELKAESANIRTIIKAKGISYPNVTGKTFAVFRVDRKHHLLSLLSMIVPSPDWIVGVSALELCLRNCSWAEYKIVNLKPWDVGTDSGTTYLSPDTPTDPREPIRRISSQFPADESNPFYDPSGEEMKPLAKLYITRQRLYEKSCADESVTSTGEEEADECALSEWGEWSSCTATCGRAFKTRSRSYSSPEAEESCKERPEAPELQETLSCELEYCEGEEVEDQNENCPEPNWSEWSSCSVTCGTGVRSRTTRRNGWQNSQKCPFVYKTEEVECYQNNCTTEEDAAAVCLLPMDQGSCNGRVERFYFHGESASCKRFIYRGCQGNENKFVTKSECEAACSTLIDPTQPREPTDDFNGIQPGSQVVENDTENPESTPGEECQVSKWSRWSSCSVSCGRGTKTKTRRIISHNRNAARCNKKLERTKPCGKRDCENYNGVDPDPPQSGESTEEPETQPGPGDCVMTRWTPWSPCSATCGVLSSQMRTRRVLNPPTDDGKPCGDRVDTRSCNLLPCKA